MKEDQPKLIKPSPLKRAGLLMLSAILPTFAALAKGFTYTFGTLTLLNLILVGTVTISAATLASPLFPLACVLGTSIVFISLGMEGKELFKTIYGKLASSLGFQNPYDKGKNKALTVAKKTTNTPPSLLARFLSTGSTLFGGITLSFAALCKAFTGAAGTIAIFLFLLKVTGVITTITLSGPIGAAVIAIGAVAGFAVGSVCAGKEGYTFYKLTKRLSNWLAPPSSEQKSSPKKTIIQKEKSTQSENPHLKRFLKFLSGILPVLAGLAKIFFYTFGALNLLNLVFMGSLTITAATLLSPLFPVACFFGVMLFPVSLGMEGASLFRKTKSKLYEVFNLTLPPSKEKEVTKEITTDMNWTSLPLSDMLRYASNIAIGKTAYFFSYFAPVAASLAKGAGGAFGTVATLLFILKATAVISVITFTAPASIAIIVVGAIAGCTIAGVSLVKEGRTFHKHATTFEHERAEANQMLLSEAKNHATVMGLHDYYLMIPSTQQPSKQSNTIYTRKELKRGKTTPPSTPNNISGPVTTEHQSPPVHNTDSTTDPTHKDPITTHTDSTTYALRT